MIIDRLVTTPVEEHNGILYKRDDLFMPFNNGVNGGKARQALYLIDNNLKHIQDNCNNTIITTTSLKSPQGLIIATVANHFGCKSITGYGSTSKKHTDVVIANLYEKHKLIQGIVAVNGSIEIIAKASYNNVLTSAVKRIANEKSYYCVDFGINATDNEDAIFKPNSLQTKNIPTDLDLLVIPVGSGLTFVGIIKGLLEYNIYPKRIVGILSGYDCTNVINNHLENLPVKQLNTNTNPNMMFFEDKHTVLDYELYKSPISYGDKRTIVEPFLIDPVYEAKSIIWLNEQIDMGNINKNDKILVWLVGNQALMGK